MDRRQRGLHQFFAAKPKESAEKASSVQQPLSARETQPSQTRQEASEHQPGLTNCSAACAEPFSTAGSVVPEQSWDDSMFDLPLDIFDNAINRSAVAFS